MTNAPADLLAHRSVMAGITGLPNPNDLGIVGDGAHQRTGGYHEGKDVLVAINRYHPPPSSHVGSLDEDYSARLLRDRNGLTLSASAFDYGDNWPHGGRAAWLRFNNALVAALRANVTALAAVRAVNYSPDGVQKLRVDRQRGWQVQTSTDQVTIHTHAEFYRDTEGRRQAALDYIANLARAAINVPPKPTPTPPHPTTEDDVATNFLARTGDGQTYYLCVGGAYSIRLSVERVNRLAYLARQATGPAFALGQSVDGKNNAEWTSSPDGHQTGIVRVNWDPLFGPEVPDNGGAGTVTITDEDAARIAGDVVEKMPPPPNYAPVPPAAG